MLDRALSPIYLPACAACDAVLDGSGPFCRPCRASLVPNEPACPRCAEPIAGPIAIACARCVRHPPPQHATIAPWRYGAAIAIALRRLKFAGRADLARALAPLAAPFIDALARTGAIDVVVPVPLHWWRLLRRGYNHAELIAAAASARLPVVRGLRRHRATQPQTGLDAAARAINVAGAFAPRRAAARHLDGKRVLLVDDVTTTGATLAAAARAAKQAGAREVYAFAVARAE